MKAPIRWTKATLEKLPAQVKGASSSNYELTDPQVAGLKLQVGTSGRKFFWFRYTYRGTKLALKIGELGPISLEEARTKALAARAIVDNGGNPQEERNHQKSMPTVREFGDGEYIPHARQRKLTYLNDVAKLRDHIYPVLADVRLSDVSTRDIQMLLGSLKDKNLSPATINRVHALLSVFFNLAVSWKRITASPCTNLKKLRENNKKERFLSPDEVRRVLAAAPQDINRVAASAISALILTGLRREEILQSRHENLDLEGASLYLPKTKNGKSRHVVLNDAAIEVFKNAPRVVGSPWIFPGKDPMKPLNNPTKAWHRILKAASVERCRLHDCRHTFASMLVNQGATLYQVKELLGHSALSSSARYSHLSSSTLRDTSQLVSDLVNNL